MANLVRENGIYRIRFRWGGKRYYRSIGKVTAATAEEVAERVDDTLDKLRRGWGSIPEGIDPGQFIMSGGVATEDVPSATKTLPTLKQAVDDYFESIPKGAKSASIGTEKQHTGHLTHILGAKTALADIGAKELQSYVNKRSKGKGHYPTKNVF